MSVAFSHTAASENERLCWMYRYTPDIITVCLECLNTFQSVVIKHSDLHVIRASDHPILARHKFSRSYWQIAYFKCFHQGLCLMIPNINIALI